MRSATAQKHLSQKHQPLPWDASDDERAVSDSDNVRRGSGSKKWLHGALNNLQTNRSEHLSLAQQYVYIYTSKCIEKNDTAAE